MTDKSISEELGKCPKCGGRSAFHIDRNAQPAVYKPHCKVCWYELGRYLDRNRAINDWSKGQ